VLAKPRSLLGSSLGTTYHTGPRTTNTSTLGFAQSPIHSGSTSEAAFYAHNETGNTYMHLLATLWMIALPIVLYPYDKDRYPAAGADDWTVFALFFLTGASYFALSTIYHVLSKAFLCSPRLCPSTRLPWYHHCNHRLFPTGVCGIPSLVRPGTPRCSG
jgi:Haemolysin-III related